MTVVDTRFTRADYARLPVGFPAQLVAGSLVKEPSPTYGHQVIVSRLYALLLPLVGPDRAPQCPVDVEIDDHNVFQPDAVVLDRIPPLDASAVGIPLLVVEILSSGTARRDRLHKIARYLEAGVREVWIVDPRGGLVERHDPEGTRVARAGAALSSVVVPGLTLAPDRLLLAEAGPASREDPGTSP